MAGGPPPEPVFVIKLQQSSHNLELLGGGGDLRSMRKQVTDGKLSGRTTHRSFRECKRRLQHVPWSKRCVILGSEKLDFPSNSANTQRTSQPEPPPQATQENLSPWRGRAPPLQQSVRYCWIALFKTANTFVQNTVIGLQNPLFG